MLRPTAGTPEKLYAGEIHQAGRLHRPFTLVMSAEAERLAPNFDPRAVL